MDVSTCCDSFVTFLGLPVLALAGTFFLGGCFLGGCFLEDRGVVEDGDLFEDGGISVAFSSGGIRPGKRICGFHGNGRED